MPTTSRWHIVTRVEESLNRREQVAPTHSQTDKTHSQTSTHTNIYTQQCVHGEVERQKQNRRRN